MTFPSKQSTVGKKLLEKIEMRKAKISIIGCGFVGSSLGSAFSQQGFPVTGYDISSKRISMLRDKFKDPKYELLKFDVNSDPQQFQGSNSDIIIICVPTPRAKTGNPDLSAIEKAVQDIPSAENKLVILESTVPVGTTRNSILTLLEGEKCKVGHNFFMGCSPERVDPGNEKFFIHNVPKLVSGITDNCGEITEYLYHTICPPILCSSPEVCETSKLLENSYRMVNSALIQEVSQFTSKIDIDIWEVIEAAKTKPFGFQSFYPSASVGGECIGVDSTALAWSAKQENCRLGLLEKALAVNDSMSIHIAWLIKKAVGDITLEDVNISGKKVLLIGASYKKDVSDTRESACRALWNVLEEENVDVQYHDPLVSSFWLSKDKQVKSVPLSNVGEFDCVVILQRHSSIKNFDEIFVDAKSIVDCCNVYPKQVEYYHKEEKVFSL
jgi:UDP-N-acetyl-D-glucosamine dehydrogenase|tara:strand:- start:2240 stop:3559 length:1320 start_codon:yes stop_codon:yes gene_type:complete